MKRRRPLWYSISSFLSRLSGYFGFLILGAIAVVGILGRRKDHVAAKIKLDDAVKNNMAEPMTLHPEIDPALCAGCGACVKACPEGEILQLIQHKAVLVEPTACVGHGACEVACPFSAITLVFGTKSRGMELPRISGDFETNVRGLYIAGELGGMGLIRNAVKQGKLAAEHAVKTLKRSGKQVDVLVVGAGPAGFSAALACVAGKASYICIEQGSVGGTIFNFPRQKVVMSHPADLPLVGTMKFPGHKVSKEQLLEYWNQIRAKIQLKIKENCKFISLKAENNGFTIETSQGTITAEKVILAMGVRGSPRKLGIPGEETSKVTYNLIDPEQYQRMHIGIVGGGNAAVEAAQYLARPEYKNRVTLIVRGTVLDRCNAENQSIIKDMDKRGQVKISWNSSVKEIGAKQIVALIEGKETPMPNDFMFIYIGAEVPFAFLKTLGITIEKKFGEALKKA